MNMDIGQMLAGLLQGGGGGGALPPGGGVPQAPQAPQPGGPMMPPQGPPQGGNPIAQLLPLIQQFGPTVAKTAMEDPQMGPMIGQILDQIMSGQGGGSLQPKQAGMMMGDMGGPVPYS